MDFYFRLCGDVIRPPTLRDQLGTSPADLEYFGGRIAQKHFPKVVQAPGEEARVLDVVDRVTAKVCEWIERNLKDHPWPGIFRELEQCFRAVMIHGEYGGLESPRT